MDILRKSCAGIVLIVALAGCDFKPAAAPAPVKQAEIGRYQVIGTDRSVYLLDTATGAVWRQIFILNNNKDAEIDDKWLGQYFERVRYFDTYETSQEYIGILQDRADRQVIIKKHAKKSGKSP